MGYRPDIRNVPSLGLGIRPVAADIRELDLRVVAAARSGRDAAGVLGLGGASGGRIRSTARHGTTGPTGPTAAAAVVAAAVGPVAAVEGEGGADRADDALGRAAALEERAVAGQAGRDDGAVGLDGDEDCGLGVVGWTREKCQFGRFHGSQWLGRGRRRLTHRFPRRRRRRRHWRRRFGLGLGILGVSVREISIAAMQQLLRD